MQYFVYIIYNEIADKYYIGQTSDLRKRIDEHNSGMSKYTAKYKGGWRIIYTEEFTSRGLAMKRERFLKNQKNKEFYKRLEKMDP